MLTPKQELFAQKFLELGNASSAYRIAYDASKMKADGIHVNACKLLANTKVALRVEELRGALEKRHQITLDDLIGELEQARAEAYNLPTPQLSAAISATMGKAKMLGFLVDKVEHGGKLTLEKLPDAELKARLDEMQARMAGAK